MDETASAADSKEHYASLLKAQLARASALRRAANADPRDAEDRLRLRAWQAQRLAHTHRDLLAAERYRPAATFFLEELYGPKDFSERDQEVERILPTLVAVLPASGIRTVALAIELDALSEELDGAMVAQLRLLGGTEAIDGITYARAYRNCGNRPAREHQLELVRQTGEALDALAHRPLIRTAIHVMAAPARLAGLGELHHFLQSGFDAFRYMGRADQFLERIVGRERDLMERLFAGAADPWD